MERGEFPQPMDGSGEVGHTGLARRSDRPCPEEAVRPAWLGSSTAPRILGGVVFQVVTQVVSVLEVMVLVVGLKSLQVVSLLGVLPLVLNTGMGGVVALRWRGGTVHDLPFVALVPSS
jgi:hypothetical protein